MAHKGGTLVVRDRTPANLFTRPQHNSSITPTSLSTEGGCMYEEVYVLALFQLGRLCVKHAGSLPIAITVSRSNRVCVEAYSFSPFHTRKKVTYNSGFAILLNRRRHTPFPEPEHFTVIPPQTMPPHKTLVRFETKHASTVLK